MSAVFETEVIEVLERIASALERQVTQWDEQAQRNIALRDENLKRHADEREAELAEARAANAALLDKINTMHADYQRFIHLWQAQKSRD